MPMHKLAKIQDRQWLFHPAWHIQPTIGYLRASPTITAGTPTIITVRTHSAITILTIILTTTTIHTATATGIHTLTVIIMGGIDWGIVLEEAIV